MAEYGGSGTKCVKLTPTSPQGAMSAPSAGSGPNSVGPCPISEYGYGKS